MKDTPRIIVALFLPIIGLGFVVALFYTALMELGEFVFSFLD